MQLNNANKIYQVFSDVLEALAFMFAEQADLESIPENVDSVIEVGINFTGAAMGHSN